MYFSFNFYLCIYLRSKLLLLLLFAVTIKLTRLYFSFGIICGPSGGSFAVDLGDHLVVWGSFAVGDHLQRFSLYITHNI